VVAQEVKALAGQTAKATEEIASQISDMQIATADSVTAIKDIGETIARVADIASTIAAAVEEQGAATGEIARNVQQAAKGTAEVATNITDVNRGAAETGSAATQVAGVGAVAGAGEQSSQGGGGEVPGDRSRVLTFEDARALDSGARQGALRAWFGSLPRIGAYVKIRLAAADDSRARRRLQDYGNSLPDAFAHDLFFFTTIKARTLEMTTQVTQRSQTMRAFNFGSPPNWPFRRRRRATRGRHDRQRAISNGLHRRGNNEVRGANRVVRSVDSAAEAIRRHAGPSQRRQRAPTAAEVDAAVAALRQASEDARGQIETAIKLSTIAENRERLTTAAKLIDDYLGNSAKLAEAVNATLKSQQAQMEGANQWTRPSIRSNRCPTSPPPDCRRRSWKISTKAPCS